MEFPHDSAAISRLKISPMIFYGVFRAVLNFLHKPLLTIEEIAENRKTGEY